MRYIDCAEFIYILNGYNDYIWNFTYYAIEYYKRYKEEQLWRVYMSKITQVYYKELPPYTQLIDTPIAKDTKKTVGKLIDRINKYNSRGEDEFI